MTVGMIHSNDRCGTAIVDSRRVFNNRKSDCARKIAQYSTDSYDCVVLGAGNAGYTNGIFETRFDERSFDDLVDRVRRKFIDDYDKVKTQMLESEKKGILQKASLIDNPEKKAGVIESATSALMNRIDNYEIQNQTAFLLCGYDKLKNRLRKFSIDLSCAEELFVPYFIIGSGSDAAGLYFNKVLQDLTIENLSLEEILFFSANAYVDSTMNMGVGGIPKIALLADKKISFMDRKKVISLINLLGAYQADIISRNVAEKYTKQLLTQDCSKEIADKLDLTENCLKKLLIPLSSWIGFANNR